MKIKLAAVAVVCAVLMGCKHTHTTPKFNLGQRVLVHGAIDGRIIHRTHWVPTRNAPCSYSYDVLLEGGAKAHFEEEYLSPKNE